MSSPHLVWKSQTFDGPVFAEPLAYGGRVFVATENNTVYALDSANGTTRWSRHLAAPVSASQLPCGNIPTVGITSTPVIDPVARRLYTVGMRQPGQYDLYALDLDSGGVRLDRRLPLSTSQAMVQGQRGALSLIAGRVLVPFGGRNSDCGDYHGLLVSVPLDSALPETSYWVPSGRGAGFWSPGGIVVDAGGAVWATTGNSFATDQRDLGNSVLQLSGDLRVHDWFTPANWKQLNADDLDLGSLSPTLIADALVFQAGKAGRGYLLNGKSLGGVGGELYSGYVCTSAYGAAVYARPHLYVPCVDGLTALSVDETARTFEVMWRGPAVRTGSPIVIGDRIWTIDIDGGQLDAFDDAGGLLYGTSIGRASHFATPSAGSGCIFAASERQLTAIGGRSSCA